MIKLITGYSDYSADDLGHLGETVVLNLPKLPVFSSLTPTPAEITTEVTALRRDAMHGPAVQAPNPLFDALATSLGEVAANAPQMKAVTETDLAEIGLPIAKTPTRATAPPDTCENLRLSHGALPGEITGKCDPAPGNIRVYEAQWTLDPNGNSWSDAETFPNSRAFKFSGLARGKDVWVRVRARNSVGAGPWSDPATIMVT